ncbi:hypothetical protein GST45_00065 [Serratia marcescens]|nr:hypothetical protein MC51_000695 [Serratia marcescens]QPI34602.1 hypothetical protein IT763_12585 [Serratia sp. CMO1]EHT9832720.1 hypothetical protein [Serratia marcescens]EIU0974032.1 hypothetical protein [Serratia marcescens]EMB7756735.1 hypothetical protein [Serratia marcescens]
MWSVVKYALFFIAGFITNFSGGLRSISDIPNSYEEFKKTYLYDESFLSGKWSTNLEYLIDGTDKGLLVGQPDIIMALNNGNSGQVYGEILSERICDAMPLTWVISIESTSPNILNFFVDRKFIVKQLHNGSMETVAELRLINEDREKGVIKLKRVNDSKSAFPEYIVFGKDLPMYENDVKKLINYCAGSSARFLKEYRSNR